MLLEQPQEALLLLYLCYMLKYGAVTSLDLTGLLVSIGLTKKPFLHVHVFLNRCHIWCFRLVSVLHNRSTKIRINLQAQQWLLQSLHKPDPLLHSTTIQPRVLLAQGLSPSPATGLTGVTGTTGETQAQLMCMLCVCNQAAHLCTLLRASSRPVLLALGHFLQMQDTDCCWELWVGNSVRRPWLNWHPSLHCFCRWSDSLGVLAHFQVFSMCIPCRAWVPHSEVEAYRAVDSK